MKPVTRIAVFFAFILSLSLPASLHAEKYKIRWVIGHPNTDFFEEAAASFKETVERKSHGDISVEIETAPNNWESEGRPAPGAEVPERVASGEAQMGHSFTDVMGGMDHRLWAFDLPFLFRDYQHMEQVVEGPVGGELLDGLKAHNIKGLAFTYSGGANILSAPNKSVSLPSDLKGMRVAVFGDEVQKAWLAALGAVPVTIRHNEENIAGLLEKGAIDAAVLTWRRHYRLGNEIKSFDTGSLEGASYLVSVTYINEKFFNSLPKAYQTLVTDATREAARIERARTIDLNKLCERRLLSRGVKAVALTDENRLRFQEALRPVYAARLEPIVGKEFIERIRKTRGDEGLVSALGR